ncbi:MAG TPA: cytochrome C oxidase subunit IV family protein [Flavobacteriales bacterium]|nr:cytochrome C oxidase subunit IV family protein [Flavobacteriales bacterium]HPF67737.1 cytochrome C oxidase subunit IV family protein [Flavobacteriales bacterium]HPJ53115.1 cytochrome C oxidase subunit IV family protein [Flavobacteriales bacterium]HPQ58585.1 cytochrome C oxidase subunit IV family protein [Flavobacteriales bacterium]HRW91098.1 cytochrome C oxidase subunit IV family protein [Flavobacteriales bacterium]
MERDDIIEYSLDAHHSEEEGRKIRKTIWMVTLLLAVVTAVEVALGAFWKEWFPGAWHLVKWTFIVLTLVKATYIVMTFMHLGDERRNIRALILLPYALFLLYLVFIAIWESNYVNRAWEMFL